MNISWATLYNQGEKLRNWEDCGSQQDTIFSKCVDIYLMTKAEREEIAEKTSERNLSICYNSAQHWGQRWSGVECGELGEG